MKVVSSARKLILQPEAEAPVVAFPEGAIINGYGVNNMNPTVVVRNGTEEEPSWQGVDHDTGCVIVNEVPEEVADAALDIFDGGGRTNVALNQAIAYLIAQGCVDQYTTPLGFIDTKLSPAGRMLDTYTGIVKRDDRDLIEAWRSGNVYYVAPSDMPRLIEPDILVRTYRNSDGTPIVLSAVPGKD